MAPIIYLIRHGEKPGGDADGLSTLGVERSQALVQCFSRKSQYNIGYILAEKRGKHGKRARPYDTVEPLAKSLGLKIDESYEQEDAKGAAAAAKAYSGPGDVLICWEHKALTNIAEALGAKTFKGHPEKKIKYPGGRFDIIWTIGEPYDEISCVSSEQCPGLDDKYIEGTGDDSADYAADGDDDDDN